MDPNIALRILVSALENGDTEKARFHFDDLVTWLEKGGFKPRYREGN